MNYEKVKFGQKICKYCHNIIPIRNSCHCCSKMMTEIIEEHAKKYDNFLFEEDDFANIGEGEL